MHVHTHCAVCVAGCLCACNRLALSPGLPRGREKEGLVFTACACAVIQILNNPSMYGYFLVYLCFDLSFLCSLYLVEMAGLDSSRMERNFDIIGVH